MTKSTITDVLGSIGIKNVGFCAFDSVKEHLLNCRAKSRLPQNSKTIIICAFPYKVKDTAPKFLSRYAAVPDYHTVVGKALGDACGVLKEKYSDFAFEYFCDNSPIPEVHTAAEAGLGVKGDNGLLITPDYGSFVFLGEIVTDLQIECENKYNECSHCGACKTKCPVALEKANCLSNLSQKKKLDDCELQILKQNNILWGCDICGDACPMNKNAKRTYIDEFIDGYRDEYVIGEDTEGRPYTWRGEEVIKRNYENLEKYPKRKKIRLENFEYNTPGGYFITICTKNKMNYFWNKVGTSIARPNKIPLNKSGRITDMAIKNIENIYKNITVDKYIIMPNHIHLLLQIHSDNDGRPMVVPTIGRIIQQMKGCITKQIGKSIWQPRFFDHVIRGEQDYKEIWQYIDNNPIKWAEDEFYTK